MQEGEHRELMIEAIAAEGRAHAALLGGDHDGASRTYAEAADLYRRSWALAPPKSYGRLVGLLKASIIGGAATAAAEEVREELRDDPDADGSPVAAYVRATAAVAVGDDDAVPGYAATMATRGEAFERTAAALSAL